MKTAEQSQLEDNIMLAKISSGQPFCSIEVSPPRDDSCDDLVRRIGVLRDTCRPIFTSISWHLESATEEPPALRLATALPDRESILLHLSTAGLNKQQILEILQKAKALNIRNIFALRGDRGLHSEVEDGFRYAEELVTFIRKQFGSTFTICVAGYPNGHSDSPSLKDHLHFLKQKVDAGADFVLTQFCFHADEYINFIKQCRSIGITVPIIPGIFPIQDAASLRFMCDLCNMSIPSHIADDLHRLSDDPTKVREYGIDYAVDMVNKILASGLVHGVHFFTFNRVEAVIEIWKPLGFITSN